MTDNLSSATDVTINEYKARKALVDYRVSLYLLLEDPQYGLRAHTAWMTELINRPEYWNTLKRCKGMKKFDSTAVESDKPDNAPPGWTIKQVQRGAGLYLLYQDATILHDMVYHLIYQTGLLHMKSTIPTVQEFIVGAYQTSAEDLEAIALYNGRVSGNGYTYTRPSESDDEHYQKVTNEPAAKGHIGDVQDAIIHDPITNINNVVWQNFSNSDPFNVDGNENVQFGSYPVNPDTQNSDPAFVAIGNANLLGSKWEGFDGKATQVPAVESVYTPTTTIPPTIPPTTTTTGRLAGAKQTRFDPSIWVRSGSARATTSAASSRAIVQKEAYDSSKDQTPSLGEQEPTSYSARALKSVMRAMAAYGLPNCCSA